MGKKLKLAKVLANHQKKQKLQEAALKKINTNYINKKGKVLDDGEGLIEYEPLHLWIDTSRVRTATTIPFHPQGISRILLCGEGDFSYARSLVDLLEQMTKDDEDEGELRWKVVATALDLEGSIVEKYKSAAKNLEYLREKGKKFDIQLIFGVDATVLHQNKLLKREFEQKEPSRIIFNFPHTGAGIKDRDRNIVHQQKLLKGYFDSSVKFVDGCRKKVDHSYYSRCSFTTTMVKREQIERVREKWSRGGIIDRERNESENEYYDNIVFKNFDEHKIGEEFQIHVTLKTGEPYDLWNIKSLATSTRKLVCSESFTFHPERYSGYQHCRTIGERNDDVQESWSEFLAGKPPKTFVFTFSKAIDPDKKVKRKLE